VEGEAAVSGEALTEALSTASAIINSDRFRAQAYHDPPLAAFRGAIQTATEGFPSPSLSPATAAAKGLELLSAVRSDALCRVKRLLV
jgi:hypothetical protein